MSEAASGNPCPFLRAMAAVRVLFEDPRLRALLDG
jgi:hypothetical protein